jgi:predicted transcriptional regulator
VGASSKKAIVFSQFVSEQFGLKRVAVQLRSKGHGVMPCS